MARQQNQQPKWSGEALAALEPYNEAYSKGLRTVAYGLALSEGVERILVKHVDSASRILAANSHDSKPWYKRHEWEVAAGGTLVGISASVPDVISGFCGPNSGWNTATPIVMTIMIGVGVALVLHGVLCGRGFFA